MKTFQSFFLETTAEWLDVQNSRFPSDLCRETARKRRWDFQEKISYLIVIE